MLRHRKHLTVLAFTVVTGFAFVIHAQPPTPFNMGDAPAAPVAVGEQGIAWYCTWEVAKEEAQRSNRPIMFMAATAQCSGVPGVF